ncbi:MAG: DUF1254 domain-containing protein [Kurthia sp.]|nr:DUF1254 domain-containing protein [Candidatus Kurthia equi]
MTESTQLKDLVFTAYQYAFPLLMMEYTRKQATNVKDVHQNPTKAPSNQFAHYRQFPVADDKSVVRFNFDTLYSFAWLDLTEGPVVLTAPHAPEKYHLIPMLDMWSDVFFVPGTRTTDGIGKNYAIAPTGWTGEVPEDMEIIYSPTPYVWIMGRIQTDGEADYSNVHVIQDEMKLTPLAHWGSDYTPPEYEVDPNVDMVTDPQAIVWNFSGQEFFTYFAKLLQVNPPHYNDYPILGQLHKLGITKDGEFTPSAEVLAVLDDAVALAQKDIIAAITDGLLGITRNSWTWMQNGSGAYGTSYRLRAMVAFAGLGCNLPEDALYPNLATDANGDLLDGSKNYTLTFTKDNMPPADAFWSLTLYDKKGFHVPNELNRFAIGDRDDLIFEEDGSLILSIQHEKPSQTNNWLPAPKELFELTMRLYSPGRKIFSEGLVLPQPVPYQ